MRIAFSQQEIKGTLAELNLPEHSYYMRRAARALDILNQGKVHFLGEDVYRVDSQFSDKHYHVELNHGNVGCTCPDNRKNPGTLCKHMIAATIYKRERQAKQATQMIIRRRNDGLYCIIDGNHLVQVSIMNNKLFCNCSICRHSRKQIASIRKLSETAMTAVMATVQRLLTTVGPNMRNNCKTS